MKHKALRTLHEHCTRVILFPSAVPACKYRKNADENVDRVHVYADRPVNKKHIIKTMLQITGF